MSRESLVALLTRVPYRALMRHGALLLVVAALALMPMRGTVADAAAGGTDAAAHGEFLCNGDY